MAYQPPSYSTPAPEYYRSAPPVPPPKPSGTTSPSRDAEHNGATELDAGQLQPRPRDAAAQPIIPSIESHWLPDILRDKSTQELQNVLTDAELQNALLSNLQTTHPALPASESVLEPLINANIELSQSALELESRLVSLREQTQARLLALRGLKQQHETKMKETEAVVWDFSPMALKQRLNASVQEQDQILRSLEESWLDEDGVASDREVGDFLRRVKEAKRLAFLRHERKDRWDEARVGGWR